MIARLVDTTAADELLAPVAVGIEGLAEGEDVAAAKLLDVESAGVDVAVGVAELLAIGVAVVLTLGLTLLDEVMGGAGVEEPLEVTMASGVVDVDVDVDGRRVLVELLGAMVLVDVEVEVAKAVEEELVGRVVVVVDVDVVVVVAGPPL